MTADVKISCPHCQRQYTMKIDPERLQRLKTRATCGRCGKTFDVASRITPPQSQAPSQTADEPATEPQLARIEVAIPSASDLQPTMKVAASATIPDLRDEMEELAREFAEAAARFTPVGVRRSSIGGGALVSDAPPPSKPAAVEEPTNPGITPASVAAASSASSARLSASAAPFPDASAWAADAAAWTPVVPPPSSATPPAAAATTAPAPPVARSPVAPSPASPSPVAPTPVAPSPVAADVDAAYDQLSLEAEPAEELARAVPTRSRALAAPRSWLDLADPGLAALQPPPSAGAAALEALLNESETIALPPPPAAS
ncbi:MAG TPA: hypothetical protein VHB97_04110 [Polyangia bacterium]|nr:hypothetical protein [Polyangia bacterium]